MPVRYRHGYEAGGDVRVEIDQEVAWVSQRVGSFEHRPSGLIAFGRQVILAAHVMQVLYRTEPRPCRHPDSLSPFTAKAPVRTGHQVIAIPGTLGRAGAQGRPLGLAGVTQPLIDFITCDGTHVIHVGSRS
jgi:hypothetical protein